MRDANQPKKLPFKEQTVLLEEMSKYFDQGGIYN
jgi:hypothetical protein